MSEKVNPYVLHVEDDDSDAYLVVKALAQSPFDLRIGRACDGVEAVAILKDVLAGTYEMPNLILLDLKLPAISGIEVLTFIREQKEFENLPVVIFTSSDVLEDINACKTLGCTDYYVKPVDFMIFRRNVNEICDKYLGENPDPNPIAKEKIAV